MEKPTDIILAKQIKEKEKCKLLGIQSKYNHTQEVKIYKIIPYKNRVVKKKLNKEKATLIILKA